MNESHIKIPLSKNKLMMMLIGSIVFVLLGICLIWLQVSIYYSFFGAITILFFGACGIYGFIKSFDRKMGLIIDSKGIYDNSSGSSIGLIRWSDVKRIRTDKIESTKLLLIEIHNPDEYIDNIENRKRALLLKATQKMCGTPFAFSSVS